MGLFKSTNGGVDWTDITDPAGAGFVGDIQMDPTDPKHVMNTWHTNCGAYSDGIGCFAETKDGGVTWKEHYGTPSWPGQVRVLMLHGSTWVVLADSILLTTDGGATYKSVLGTSAGGHSSGTLYRAKNGDYFIGTEHSIIRSPAASDGSQWDVLANSGQWVGDLAESATTMFATQGQNRLMTSPVGDGVKWTMMADGPSGCGRARYDLDHHLLYVECGGHGLWRVVKQ
jgi:hypothetical protein